MIGGRIDRVSCWFCTAPAEVFVATGAQFRLPEGCSISINGKDRYVCPGCARGKALITGETPKGAA
jgi:hypothetical protein